MPIKAGQYMDVKALRSADWRRARGEPEGVDEVLLHKHEDGSYTHVMRIEKGVEYPTPVTHDFYEEAYYIEGEMLNTRSNVTIKGGAYVFHEPGEAHGPFRCMKTCLILEFRYYKR